MELYTLHGAYALPLHHTKYDIWLWRISYVELFFTPTEFNRNMAINLKTVHRMTNQMTTVLNYKFGILINNLILAALKCVLDLFNISV